MKFYVFSIKYRLSFKTFRVIKIVDLNRTEPTCYNTIFPYSRSGEQNEAFLYIVLLDSRIGPWDFPIGLKNDFKKYFSLGTYQISLVVVMKDLDLGLN